MTTAADIIEQYGRTVHAHPEDYSTRLDLDSDMQTLALIVRDWGNAPIPDGQDQITRDNLGLCLAGQNHWWWNCDEHNCRGSDQ